MKFELFRNKISEEQLDTVAEIINITQLEKSAVSNRSLDMWMEFQRFIDIDEDISHIKSNFIQFIHDFRLHNV